MMCTNIPVYYTESKLNRLEGGNKRNLRSRDILSALTEARDDHLSQPAEYTQPATLSVTEDTAATNNPWSSTNTGQCHYHCSAAHVALGTLNAMGSPLLGAPLLVIDM